MKALCKLWLPYQGVSSSVEEDLTYAFKKNLITKPNGENIVHLSEFQGPLIFQRACVFSDILQFCHTQNISSAKSVLVVTFPMMFCARLRPVSNK